MIMRNTACALIAAIATLWWFAGVVHAQPQCPEGRTLDGACVNADLAQSMRKQAIVSSQPKFSFTNPPVLPIEDGDYAVLPDFREIRSLFSFSPLTTRRE
jgi:hypothetical protein